MSKFLCIYHANCADGFGAAWVVRRALGDCEVEFHRGVYGEAPPDVTGRDVLMVDFSYKRPVIMQMIAQSRSLLILDHHKTAEADLSGLPLATGWERHLRVGHDDIAAYGGSTAAAVFDMNRSGAGLTWDFFNPGRPRPKLIDHIEDRDLWRFQLPGTRAIQAALSSFPYDFETWDGLMADDREEDLRLLIKEGEAIERKHFKDIEELLKVGQRRMIIAGHDVPVCNLPYTLSSDAGHAMGKGEKFAACYMDTPAGRVFSLRSAPDGLDVSGVAKMFGGGGHKNAAGFTVPHDTDVSRPMHGAVYGGVPAPTQAPNF
jgi:hypothetical protein